MYLLDIYLVIILKTMLTSHEFQFKFQILFRINPLSFCSLCFRDPSWFSKGQQLWIQRRRGKYTSIVSLPGRVQAERALLGIVKWSSIIFKNFILFCFGYDSKLTYVQVKKAISFLLCLLSLFLFIQSTNIIKCLLCVRLFQVLRINQQAERESLWLFWANSLVKTEESINE